MLSPNDGPAGAGSTVAREVVKAHPVPCVPFCPVEESTTMIITRSIPPDTIPITRRDAIAGEDAICMA